MAREQEDGQEKTEEPSQYRIDEFRSKGQVAQSKEVSSILILLATFMGLIFSITYIYETLSEYVHWILSINHEQAFLPAVGHTIVVNTLSTLAKCAAPVTLIALVVGIVSNVMQIGFLFAPEAIEWKLDKLNPIAGIQRLFSMKSIIDTVKGIAKFVIVGFITFTIFKTTLPNLGGFFNTEINNSIFHAKDMFIHLIGYILLGLGVVAILDYAWEKYNYNQELRQTKKELKEEMKEREGNPQIKQKIRSLQREFAQKKMMKEVKKADVIITNPTHFSVAIKYDVKTMVAPKVVAKGQDLIALRIRELAKQNNIPMVENVPLARTLYSTIKVGESIPRTLYKAVAEVLAFVYKLNKKKKALETNG
ncbi:MAG: flagellar biosynthesis protein FlhB [Bacteriovoracaceae bacterium]